MKPQDAQAWARRVERTLRSLETEYHCPPLAAEDDAGRVTARDALLIACRRGEREVQITRAFADRDFRGFERPRLEGLEIVTLTRYHEDFRDLPCLLSPIGVEDVLGEILAAEGVSQLRVAESEKFAHITRFLNGNRTAPFGGEERIRIPSPKNVDVETVPWMAAAETARACAEGIRSKRFAFTAVNFANGDVIGHLGNFEAKRRAAESVDAALGVVVEAAERAGACLLVTADHGVLETGFRPDGRPNVSHTDALVPFHVRLPGGGAPLPAPRGPRAPALKDVAPAVLASLGLAIPCAMTGVSPFAFPAPAERAVLVVLDGWGAGEASERNPIFAARTPVFDGLARRGPGALLRASGEAVGLIAGKAGNSEAGHMNLGAGRVVLQDDRRIEAGIRDGSLGRHPALLGAVEKARSRGGVAHVLGLVSDRSSHGTWREMAALARGAAEAGSRAVFLHCILDGRSAPPGSAPGLIEDLGAACADRPEIRIATVLGRGYALDRDGNWASKTRVAYDALVGPSSANRAREGRRG